MIDAALADGSALRHSIFEVFTRRLPAGRRYGVFAGVGRALAQLEDFHFADEELSFLSKHNMVSKTTLDWLANYHFTGSICGYSEGECYFPGSPLLTVEGTFAEAVVLETLLLSICNYDSAVAAAASRMTATAGNRACLEMGARRAHEQAAVAAARAAVIAGFAGTSNLEAGRRYGLQTIGTAAHSFTLLHDDEAAAFQSQIAARGTDTTLLVDTFDTIEGVKTAIKIAGTDLGGVRLDSGDLPTLAVEVRELLDSLGAENTTIVVSSDLDEYAIAALQVAPIDAYGVGTSVVTGSGAATCGMVYKLVARHDASGQLQPVHKRSLAKASIGGRKSAARQLSSAGRATAELVIHGPDAAVAGWRPDDASQRPLVVPLVCNGEIDQRWVGAAGVATAASRHRASRAELPVGATRLSADEPAIETVKIELF